ncbi:MAG: phosphodiester glycosidase family protein [Candidatus Eisenbacteria sp.]|nr:phosphodiester glycosidase family protein [Candidatus Eisenbacteria bacterium]
MRSAPSGIRFRLMVLVFPVVVVSVSLPLGASFAVPVSSGTVSEDPAGSHAGGKHAPWEMIEPGLEFGVLKSPLLSDFSDSRIRILRIDPDYFEFRLMMASAADGGRAMTAREWCLENGLVAAINASMYQSDHVTSIGLMKTRTHTNNSHLTEDNAVFAFDRLDDEVPPIQIIDRQCQNLDSVGKLYGTLVQGIRMVSCYGNNVWSPQEKRWSSATIGIDRQGRALFIFVRSPYRMHDLVNILLELPIDLKSLQYAEGGPEAQLYINGAEQERELFGSYETDFRWDDDNDYAWRVPNVVGIVRRSGPDDEEGSASSDFHNGASRRAGGE